jgi:hypothetical protein
MMADAIYSERVANPSLVAEIASNSKYIVSGVMPGLGGSGLFLSELVPCAQRVGYRLLAPCRPSGLSDAEQIIISSVRDSEVLIFHPQTLGIACVRALYEAGNKLSLYVLDNSFFCLQSYNHRKQKRGECFDCLGDLSRCASECVPFPVSYSRAENLTFLQWLQEVAPTIKFFCQTQHQAALLAAHFGPNIRCQVVGMKTPEFAEWMNDTPSSVQSSQLRFNVVYHGHVLEAKGVRYVLELARELPELSFLVPGSVEGIRAEVPGCEIPRNCSVANVSWSTGLKEAVVGCDVVLCPSEWSAPVEGALLKSMHYNGSVGILETRYGFEREIPSDVLLKLPLDAQRSAQLVRDYLPNRSRQQERARAWVKRYLQSTRLEEIFIVGGLSHAQSGT